MKFPIYIQRKEIRFSLHAIIRAEERNIRFPELAYLVVNTGEIERFGKHGIKFRKRFKKGTIICIGIDLGECILIKTIERGN